MEAIKGVLKSLSQSYNGSWRFGMLQADEPISIVGAIPDLQLGDLVVCRGQWKQHAKYGRQFQVEHAEVEIPKDAMGVRCYLDRHFKWVGPVLAGKLVERFGDDLFHIIERQPELLSGISGITQTRALEIHNEYLSIKNDQQLDTFFAGNGITVGLRNRLVDRYGSKQKAIEAIKENPYALADEVFNVGFKRADAIAMQMGIKKDSRRRASAGIKWILGESAESEGHCCLPLRTLVERSRQILEAGEARISEEIQKGLNSGNLVLLGDDLYRADLYRAEISVAAKLRELTVAHHAPVMHNLTRADIEELDSDQHQALINALSSKISVITGGPGTGKTYTLNYILKALGRKTSIELAAPTGKASKRMSEATGYPARTIHRLLEYSPQNNCFNRNAENPLECDTLIIDESSMIDIKLMANLMDAVTTKTQVIFTGDVDQLSSVGPGRVLADMIDSGNIPVSRLTQLHRQAQESLININAKRINSGKKLDLSTAKSDFWFVPEEDPQKIPELIIKAIQKIPGQFGLMPDDVQVLCPQKRGPVGTENLNKILKPYLNPNNVAFAGSIHVDGKLPGVSFFKGDRVIQTRNNYGLEIFNGDIGEVAGADKDYLYVNFEGLGGKVKISYPLVDIDDLKLAYALTIHKSQGSEFPCVIIPVHTTNYMMLKRNLLYTGITRGKRLVVLAGTMKAVSLAIRTIDNSKRNSNLKHFIREGIQ
jgi:exodeoxyribonuclease V alpha subunit